MAKKLWAEWLGTFSLVFFGCGSTCLFHFSETPVSPLVVSLTFGATIALMITLFAKTSGAHFNPVVSFAFYRKGQISALEFFLFSLAQCLAGFVAALALSEIFPDGQSFGATLPQIHLAPTLFMEALLSFTLVLVILIVALTSRLGSLLSGLIIGGTVSLCSLLGGGLTGASMNPARTLGPNFFEGQTEVLWIYFFAPLTGAVLAVGTYNLFFHGGKNYETRSLSMRR